MLIILDRPTLVRHIGHFHMVGVQSLTTKMYTCTLALNVNKIKRGGFVNINLAFKSSNRCLATSMYMICNIIYWLIGSQ